MAKGSPVTLPRRTSGGRRVQVVAILAIVSIGVVSIASSLGVLGGGKSKITPPPALFPDAALAPASRELETVRQRADKLASGWLRSHPGRDDAGFAAFVLRQIPAPPDPQTAGLAGLRKLVPTRSPAGDRAALWLELNGKKAIWKLYAKQYGQLAPRGRGKLAKASVKAGIKLAQSVVAQGLPRFRSRAPYEVDRKLADFAAGKDQKARLAALASGGAVRYSYPSKHAADAAAAITILEAFDPHRRGEFEWMADQVVYSRMYAGGHFPSDIRAGALIGYMIGDYELRLAGVRT